MYPKRSQPGSSRIHLGSQKPTPSALALPKLRPSTASLVYLVDSIFCIVTVLQMQRQQAHE